MQESRGQGGNDALGGPHAFADLNMWRWQGAKLIQKTMADHKCPFRDMVIEQETRLVPFANKSLRTFTAAGQTRLHGDLEKIFQTAVRLEEIFRTSKACFSLKLTNPKCESRLYQYEPECMEVETRESDGTPSKKSRVILVISPALFKTGTATGKDYDTSICLVKAKVACN